MPLLNKMGLDNIQLSMRLRGAGYRRYSSQPASLSPRFNRHWFRHVIVSFSPCGIKPMPLQIWLGFPDFGLVNCSHMGMVRFFLIEACSPDWSAVEALADDLERASRVGEDDAVYLIERFLLL